MQEIREWRWRHAWQQSRGAKAQGGTLRMCATGVTSDRPTGDKAGSPTGA